MEAFLTAILVIFFIIFGLVAIGIYLMSKMLGGFGNLRAIYRLFSGRGQSTAQQRTAHSSSSSGHSSRTYTNKEKTTKNSAQTPEKMFEQNEGTYVDFEEVRE